MSFDRKMMIALLGIVATFAFWLKFVSKPPGEFKVPRRNIYFFDNTSGPPEKSVMPKITPTSWQQYSKGTTSRMAILLTDEKSSWLGLAHGLKTIGVPFVITRDYQKAVQHRVVMIYPRVASQLLNERAESELKNFVNSGGTLLGINVYSRGLHELFGLSGYIEGQKHFDLTFTEHPAGFTGLTEPEERTISLGKQVTKGDVPIPEPVMPSLSYSQTSGDPIAVYADGNAAITYHRSGRGQAFAFGVDPGLMMLKSYGNRDDEIGRYYVNNFEPTLDMFLRLLKKIYHQANTDGVTLETVPFNRSLTVLITHDVDFTKSVQNSLAYAEFEKNQNIRATYFINTKYIRDYNDDVFMNDDNLPALRQLLQSGMELGSHSVSHSYVYKRQEPGTGEERYPDYQPFVHAREKLTGASVMGELRVSKFLLDHLTGNKTISFRPGELSNPFCLSNALEATGYKYSSSVTANDSFTHLPFQLNYDRGFEGESPIFEFPVTLEDEEMKDMMEWSPQGIAVAHKIARYGGVCNVLIHPNVTDHKLAFLKEFVAKVKDVAWFDTVGNFGGWWAARNNTEVDVASSGQALHITLMIPQTIKGLTLQIPEGMQFQKAEPASTSIKQSGNKLVIAEASAGKIIISLAK